MSDLKDCVALIDEGDCEGVASILDKNAELANRRIVIERAIAKSQLDIISLLCSRGVDVNRTIRSESLLALAAAYGDVRVMDRLLELGATVQEQYETGTNPFSGAIYNKHPEAVRWLLEKGVDPHVVYVGEDGESRNVLSHARIHGTPEIVSILDAAGCKMPVQDPADEPSAERHAFQPPFTDLSDLRLCIAAIKDGDVTSVASMLDKHEDLPRDPYLVETAIRESQLEIIELLSRYGLDMDSTIEEESLVAFAAAHGDLRVLNGLVALGATVQKQYAPGTNPFSGAIYNKHPEAVRWLLEKGVDPHVVYVGDGTKRNVLSHARTHGTPEIVSILEAAGCEMPVQESRADCPHQGLISAMSDRFGKVEELSLQSVLPSNPSVNLNVIRPTEAKRFMTLFTTGMSDVPLQVDDVSGDSIEFAELMMSLPEAWGHPLDGQSDVWNWPFLWLRRLAVELHGNSQSLSSKGTIISPTHPEEALGPNTEMTCFLVQPARLQPVVASKGEIRFMTVLPVFTEERDYAVLMGLNALYDRLEEHGVSLLFDPSRSSVV